MPVRVSRIRKKKGWSARKIDGRLSDRRRSGNHDPRGRRGLGSFFLDLDERLVNDRRNRQFACACDPREIGRPRLERHRHPQLRERILELALRRQLELG